MGRFIVVGLALLASGCSGSTPLGPSGDAVFLVRACAGSESSPQGELFRILVPPALVDQADGLIGVAPGDPRQRIVLGAIRRGPGGVNAPWRWHVDPQTIAFVEAAIELCDGCPSMIERDIDGWIGQVGQFCPWSTEMVRRER